MSEVKKPAAPSMAQATTKEREQGPTQEPVGVKEQDKGGPRPIEAVYKVPVTISAVLGSATLSVEDVLKITRGTVIELDKRIGDPVDVYINDRVVAKGEVVMVDDRLGLQMTSIMKVEI